MATVAVPRTRRTVSPDRPHAVLAVILVLALLLAPTVARPRGARAKELLLAARKGWSHAIAKVFTGGPLVNKGEVRTIPMPPGSTGETCTTALDCSIQAAQQFEATSKTNALRVRMCAKSLMFRGRSLRRAQRVVHNIKAQTKSIAGRLASERNRAEAAEQYVRTLQSSLSLHQQMHAQYKSDISSRDQALITLKSEKDRLTATLEQLTTKVGKLEEGALATEQHIEAAKKMLQEERAIHAKEKHDLMAQVDLFADQKRQLVDSRDEELHGLRERIDSLSSQLRSLQNDNAAIALSLSSERAERREENVQHQQIVEKLDSHRKSVEDLTQQVAASAVQMEKEEALVREQQQQMQAAAAQLRDTQERLVASEHLAAHLRDKYARAAAELAMLQGALGGSPSTRCVRGLPLCDLLLGAWSPLGDGGFVVENDNGMRSLPHQFWAGLAMLVLCTGASVASVIGAPLRTEVKVADEGMQTEGSSEEEEAKERTQELEFALLREKTCVRELHKLLEELECKGEAALMYVNEAAEQRIGKLKLCLEHEQNSVVALQKQLSVLQDEQLSVLREVATERQKSVNLESALQHQLSGLTQEQLALEEQRKCEEKRRKQLEKELQQALQDSDNARKQVEELKDMREVLEATRSDQARELKTLVENFADVQAQLEQRKARVSALEQQVEQQALVLSASQAHDQEQAAIREALEVKTRAIAQLQEELDSLRPQRLDAAATPTESTKTEELAAVADAAPATPERAGEEGTLFSPDLGPGMRGTAGKTAVEEGSPMPREADECFAGDGEPVEHDDAHSEVSACESEASHRSAAGSARSLQSDWSASSYTSALSSITAMSQAATLPSGGKSREDREALRAERRLRRDKTGRKVNPLAVLYQGFGLDDGDKENAANGVGVLARKAGGGSGLQARGLRGSMQPHGLRSSVSSASMSVGYVAAALRDQMRDAPAAADGSWQVEM